jgi:hypothetical protein
VSCTSSFPHLLTLLFRLGKSVYTQYLPRASFEIFAVIQENGGPGPVLE